MRMTLEEARKRFPDRPEPPPVESAGRWIAWNSDRSEIIADGEDFRKVFDAARSTGCEVPILKFVIGRAFIGSQ